VPGLCKTTCETIDPLCCAGQGPGGQDGVCDPTTHVCCFPQCTGKTCGDPDGCGGVCGCTPPMTCIPNSKVCAIVADAFVPKETFNSVALSTIRGGPVNAQFKAPMNGLIPTLNPDECGLVQEPGVNQITLRLAPGETSPPPQRITYWTAEYFGQDASDNSIYVLSCMIHSFEAAGFPAGTSGPFYLVDPAATQFGSLLSSVAPELARARCVLTPMTPAKPGEPLPPGCEGWSQADPSHRPRYYADGASHPCSTFVPTAPKPLALTGYVQITATLSSGLCTLASNGGAVAWEPGNVLPGTKGQVLWLFGGCTSDVDCFGSPQFPYCQVDHVCSSTPSAAVALSSIPTAVPTDDCVTTCAKVTHWNALGFPAAGIVPGSMMYPDGSNDGSGSGSGNGNGKKGTSTPYCVCQAYVSVEAANAAGALARAQTGTGTAQGTKTAIQQRIKGGMRSSSVGSGSGSGSGSFSTATATKPPAKLAKHASMGSLIAGIVILFVLFLVFLYLYLRRRSELKAQAAHGIGKSVPVSRPYQGTASSMAPR
jgi:hypothetical protein